MATETPRHRERWATKAHRQDGPVYRRGSQRAQRGALFGAEGGLGPSKSLPYADKTYLRARVERRAAFRSANSAAWAASSSRNAASSSA